jgi:hypothetical protein
MDGRGQANEAAELLGLLFRPEWPDAGALLAVNQQWLPLDDKPS